MSQTTITPILVEATEEKRALGAYNVYTCAQVDALIKVHERYESPLIIQVADPANGFLGCKTDFMSATAEDRKKGAVAIGKKFREAAEKAKIPVCLHLDHGKSLEAITNAIDAGFTSVMFDGSHLPYEENVRMTKEAVEIAHSRGVSIEAELGVLGGTEDDVHAEHSLFTKPEEALDFVKRTGVDCLAISYGTQHGANKGKNAVLRTDIVEEVRAIFAENGISCPIVSHGSSSVPQDIVQGINDLGGSISNAYGIGSEQLKEAIGRGISKINVDTDIRLATALAFRQYFSDHTELSDSMQAIKAMFDEDSTLFDPRVFLGPVICQVTGHEEGDQALAGIEKLLEEGVLNICNRTIPVFSGKEK